MPENTPVTLCRCCQQPMRQDWQPGLMAHHSGFWLVTCDNRACPMFSHTFSVPGYEAISLEPYMQRKVQA